MALVRQQVFIEEQAVAVELEWDGLDDNASHWLALNDEFVIGTARLLASGQLGRMAVLPAYRQQGIGRRLLDAIIEHGRQQQLFEIHCHAQLQAMPFYYKAGFTAEGSEFLDAGIAHFSMRLRLSEQRLLGLHGGKFSIQHLADATQQLIAQVDCHLRILSFDLDHAIFDQKTIVDTISRLARKSRFSEIKLLIIDSRSIASRGHQLLQLQQRLSSTIALRKINDDSREIKHNLIIADHCGVICQSMKEPALIWGNYNNRPIAEDFIAQFDALWNRASPDPNLRRVSI